MLYCLHDQVLYEGLTGVASERSCKKIPSRPAELLPASSETYVLLAKTELISDGGNASVIKFKKKGNVFCEDITVGRE